MNALRNKIIGIVGGSGAVGKTAVSQLINDGYECIVSYRSREIESPDIKSKCECIKLDIYDDEAVRNFCKRCGLILNCAGPSYIIGSKVAEIALNEKCKYVDAFGVTIFNDDNIRKLCSNEVCILGAGSVPGLSGIAVMKMISLFDKCNSIDFYSYAMENTTKTSAIDVLLSSLSGYGYSDKYYKNGKILSINLSIPEGIEVFGTDRVIPAKSFLYNEMIHIAKKFRIDQISSYNLIPDENLHKKMTEEIASYIIMPDEDKIYECADRIEKLINTYMFGRKPEYLISVKASGIENGNEKQTEMCIKMKNSFKVTGIISALTAEKAMEIFSSGMYWAYEIMDAANLIDKLYNENVCSIVLKDDNKPEEEGEI